MARITLLLTGCIFTIFGCGPDRICRSSSYVLRAKVSTPILKSFVYLCVIFFVACDSQGPDVPDVRDFSVYVANETLLDSVQFIATWETFDGLQASDSTMFLHGNTICLSSFTSQCDFPVPDPLATYVYGPYATQPVTVTQLLFGEPVIFSSYDSNQALITTIICHSRNNSPYYPASVLLMGNTSDGYRMVCEYWEADFSIDLPPIGI